MGKFVEMRFNLFGSAPRAVSSGQILAVLTCFLIFISGGCAKAYIPRYLQSRNPYIRRFHAGFEPARRAAILALAEEGWIVEEESDPVVYERHPFNDLDARQSLLISNDRETWSLWGRRHAIANVFLRHKNDVAEVEIRVITVTEGWLKARARHRHDSLVEGLFKRIEQSLEGKSAP
jgi:hypothetical protein